MNELSLIDNKNMVLKTGTTNVMKELMNIISSTGCVPRVEFDGFSNLTKLEFEGMYNNFNLYIKGE